MRIEQIEDLMTAMQRHDIEELTWREKESQVQIRRSSSAKQSVENKGEVIDLSREKNSAASINNEQQLDAENPNHWIVSPMVGTCYLTPAPESKPFARLGDHLEESSVLCIIEAMKVMNEVRVPFAGKLMEISVKSGEAVEFGTPLFRISPLASEIAPR